MCGICGCEGEGHEDREVGVGARGREGAPGEEHVHAHDDVHVHDHVHGQEHAPGRGRSLPLEARVLAKNDRLAAENRAWLARRGVLALNLMSSPGAGKTSLLERTARERGRALQLAVIEGDQATDRDAARMRAAGVPAVQFNTGSGCHLDAAMVGAGLAALDPGPGALVVIENVGNLVCPALFDLGEGVRVVLASVPEGDDKPAKYPHMFRSADLVLLNKIDLLPHVAFDLDRFTEGVAALCPRALVLRVSASRGDGLDAWYGWLDQALRPHRARPCVPEPPGA